MRSKATTHILELTVGAPPQALTDGAREPVAAQRRGGREQLADALDVNDHRKATSIGLRHHDASSVAS